MEKIKFFFFILMILTISSVCLFWIDPLKAKNLTSLGLRWSSSQFMKYGGTIGNKSVGKYLDGSDTYDEPQEEIELKSYLRHWFEHFHREVNGADAIVDPDRTYLAISRGLPYFPWPNYTYVNLLDVVSWFNPIEPKGHM